MSLILVALVSSLVINTFFFVAAVLNRSDRVTDLSYCLTFIFIVLQYTLTQSNPTFFQTLMACMVTVWALRLGTHLFLRIIRLKSDSRFDGIRDQPLKFARFWFLQAISITIIILPVLVVLLARHIPPYGLISFLGFLVWAAGLALETVADFQKSQYKKLKNPPTPWVSTGLYKYARHPNYFGEMLCWWGIFIYTLPYLSGWNWIAIASPVYITWLLIFVTGIPPLLKKYAEKYASHPDYAAYISSTHLLIPIPKK
jgi:steroid 5-alpha reductase family enzyme